MTDEQEKPKKRRKLTIKQQRFVANVADGILKAQAYVLAYDKAGVTPSIAVHASETLQLPYVQESLKEFLERRYPNLKDTVGTYLLDLINDPEKRDSDKLKAIQLLVETYGWKAPTKSQHLTAKINMDKYRLPGDDK